MRLHVVVAVMQTMMPFVSMLPPCRGAVNVDGCHVPAVIAHAAWATIVGRLGLLLGWACLVANLPRGRRSSH